MIDSAWLSRYETHITLVISALIQFGLLLAGFGGAQLAVCTATAIYCLGLWHGRETGYRDGEQDTSRRQVEAYLHQINEALAVPSDPAIRAELEFEGIRARALLDKF